jgi:TonB family protein
LGAVTPMSKTTVLLIDYEPASIEQMKAPLLAAGYHVEVVMDGVAGLKAFTELKPDLVLIEAMIPKKHGFEVCQEIKNTTDGKRTPVVIATSIYKGRKYRNQALQNYGCDEYLEKPVGSEQLMEVCHKLLGDLEEAIDQVVKETSSPSPAPAEPAGLGATEATLQKELEAMTEDDISDRLDEILGGDDTPQAVASDSSMSDVAEMVDEIPAVEPTFAELPEVIAVDELPVESAPLEATSATELPVEEEQAELTSVGEAPVEEVPLEATSATELPVEEAPVELTSVSEAPVEEVPLETTSATEAPVEETPIEVAPIEVTSVQEPPVEVTVNEAPQETEQEAPAVQELEGTTVREPVSTGSDSSRSGVGIWIGLAAVILIAVGSFMFIRGMGGDTPALVEQEVPVVPASQAAETGATSPSTLETLEELTQPPSGTPVEMAEAVTEPVTRPVTRPVAKPVAKPVAEVVAEPVARPVAKPAAEVVAEPVARPVTNPVAEVVAEPVADPAGGFVAEPGVQTPDTAVSNPESSSEMLMESPVEVPFEPVAAIPLQKAPLVEAPAPQVAPVPLKAKRGDLVPLREVDVKPVQTRNVKPRYHPMARQRGQQGTVTLDLLINETGRVTDVNIVKGIPRSQLNDMAAIAARSWAYEPAMKDGVAVKVWKRVAIAFRL